MQRQANPPLPSRTHSNARELRRLSTDAELLLWYHLRAGRLDGLKFRRQHPCPPYVADFYCHEAALVIELDGSQHGDEVDAARNQALEMQGLHVLRIWNHDVLQNTSAVLAAILGAARHRTDSDSHVAAGNGLNTPNQETA